MDVEYIGRAEDSNGVYIGEKYTVGGYTFYVYFPKDMAEQGSYDASIYLPGSGKYLGNPAEYTQISDIYASGENSDKIFIAFSQTQGYRDATGPEAVEALLSELETSKSISVDITTVEGFSLGGRPSMNYFYDLITNGDRENDVQRTLIVYGGSNHSNPADVGAEEYGKALAESGSRLVAVIEPGMFGKYSGTSGYGAYFTEAAKLGVPTALIWGKSQHGGLTMAAMESGFTEYLEGKIEFTDIKSEFTYKGSTKKEDFSIAIPTTNSDGTVTWTTYKLTQLQEAAANPSQCSDEERAALEYIEGLRETVALDFEFLKSLADISKKIEEFCKVLESVLNIGPHSTLESVLNIGPHSTSKLLEVEKSIFNKIINASNALSSACSNDLNVIANAEEMYEELENKLKQFAEETDAINQALLPGLYEFFPELKPVEKPEEEKTEETTTTTTGGGGYYSHTTTGTPGTTETPGTPLPTEPETPAEPAAPVEPEPPTSPVEEPEPVSTPVEEEPVVIIEPETPPTPTPQKQTTTRESSPMTSVSQEPSTSVSIETPVEEPTQTISELPTDSSTWVPYDDFPTDEPELLEPETSKKDGTLGKIGIGLGVAGAAAAGLYGAKKYYENKFENGDTGEYGSEETPSLEEQYSGFNRRIDVEPVEKYKARLNDDSNNNIEDNSNNINIVDNNNNEVEEGENV